MTNKNINIEGAIHEAIDLLDDTMRFGSDCSTREEYETVITKLQAILNAVPEDREPDESDCPYEIAYTDGYNEGLYLIQKITKEVE